MIGSGLQTPCDIAFKLLANKGSVIFDGQEDFVDALRKMYKMSRDERNKLGKKGRAHVEKNYNFETFSKRWVEVIDQVIDKHSSWSDRQAYQSWSLKEIA